MVNPTGLHSMYLLTSVANYSFAVKSINQLTKHPFPVLLDNVLISHFEVSLTNASDA